MCRMERPFESVETVAAKLGVPTHWLKAEALAGHVPALNVGRRLLLDAQQVRDALSERARERQREPVHA